MSKVKSFKLIVLAMIVLFILCPLTGITSTGKVLEKSGPDRIVIQLETESGKNEMPGVGFLHDLHTRAVGDDCTLCHDEDKGIVVFRFKRTVKPATMELYHKECVACHADKKAAKEAFGPLTAECRSCHVQGEPESTSWKELKFDRSLHFKHEKASVIKPKTAKEKDNCSRCHHQYNEKTKDIFFTPGQEEACSYCHKAVEKDDIRSNRQASHDSCVSCHLTLKSKKVSAGPVLCAGCHDAANQQKIKTVKDVPRLKRNQPDVVAITGWKSGAKPDNAFMDPVAFNHKFHEAKTDSCKACHHQTLKKCKDCHSIDGGDIKGGFVSLEKAMHDTKSTQSCVGCHKKATAADDCAGCHFMTPATASKQSCTTCHSLTPGQLSKMEPVKAAEQALKKLDTRYKVVPTDKIPEEVTIGLLSKEYAPSVFPHRKVVQAIIGKVEKNEMAKSFHVDQAGLCMGCHHNSPKSLEPPKCASCHNKLGPGMDGRSGLKGAYHGQCITCHQKMKVESVLATDCVKCHELKK